MGNIGSSGRGNNSRRRHRNQNNQQQQQHPPPPPTTQPPQTEISGNRYVFAASTPYPPPPPPPPPPQHQYQNPNTPPQYYQYTGYYPPQQQQQQQPPLPAPYDHHHRSGGDPAAAAAHANWVGAGGGRYPCGPVPPPPAPYVEHQKAVTIRNDVNIKKETLKVVPDEDNPGHFLISFSFDATVAGSITLMFFAKEGADCNLISMKENMPEAVTVSFQQGLGQIFKQPPATGINFTMFEEAELRKSDDVDVYPLVVKAEASPLDFNGAEEGDPMPKTINAQITQVVFEKDKGEYQVRVVKQMLWVNGMRYELQEIYGIGNSVENEFDGSEQGKECVICLSEPRDTTVLPCRHMCMCSGCAKVLRFQTSRCPICRQPVDRLLEIKVNNKTDD